MGAADSGEQRMTVVDWWVVMCYLAVCLLENGEAAQ